MKTNEMPDSFYEQMMELDRITQNGRELNKLLWRWMWHSLILSGLLVGSLILLYLLNR